MPVFTFSGKDASGQKISGERMAANKQSLAQALRRERITPGAIREKGKEFSMPTFGTTKVKTKDIAIFFRQFSVMIDAGLPLVQCLEILGANQENPTVRQTLTGVRTTVEGGATLANAMRQYPNVFDDLSTNMIEAGETGGILDIILQRLATYVEKAVKLRSAVKSALIYPVAVVSMAFLIVGALLKWVVPIFANLFAGLDVALPLPTRIVMGLSAFVGQFWWFFIVGVVGLVVGIKQIRKDRRGRYWFDYTLLKLPILGILLRKIADFYEDEVDSATKDMLAMLEPVIIGLLGVMIGGIVISLYMPLFAMIAKLAG